MDPQLTTQLVSLGAVVIGALGTLVTLLTERIKRELTDNTQLTRETRQGLQDAVERLAQARDTILGLRAIVREREDRIAYLVARHPEVEATLRTYRDRRQQRATAAEEAAAERRILEHSDDLSEGDRREPTRG